MATKKSPAPSVTNNWLENLKSNKTVIILVALGFVVGVLWFTAMRYFLLPPKETHYHANFAVFINGEREPFSSFTYYEEVAACSSAYASNPKGRVHMHNQVNDVIHVHDERVTYGHFFANIGWTVGDDILATDAAVYQSNTSTTLTYYLNGKEVDRIDNLIIGNTDRLLISYGNTADVAKQFETVASSAEEVNKYKDPSSCGGLNGSGYDSVLSRLKRATFWSE